MTHGSNAPTLEDVLPVAVLIVLVVVVAVLAWRSGPATRGCCSSGPWPPVDLAADEAAVAPARPATRADT